MVDPGSEFSFFQGIHVWTDIRGKQVHLQELTQIRLIKQVLVTSSKDDMTK